MAGQTRQWWKVLDRAGFARYGKTMQWSLPKDGQPDEWHEVEGELELCKNGLHLTEHPDEWWDDDGCTCYLAEYEGEAIEGTGNLDSRPKLVARRARLVRPATKDETRAFAGKWAAEQNDDDDEDW